MRRERGPPWRSVSRRLILASRPLTLCWPAAPAGPAFPIGSRCQSCSSRTERAASGSLPSLPSPPRLALSSRLMSMTHTMGDTSTPPTPPTARRTGASRGSVGAQTRDQGRASCFTSGYQVRTMRMIKSRVARLKRGDRREVASAACCGSNTASCATSCASAGCAARADTERRAAHGGRTRGPWAGRGRAWRRGRGRKGASGWAARGVARLRMARGGGRRGGGRGAARAGLGRCEAGCAGGRRELQLGTL